MSEADVQANSEGKITPEQHQILRSHRRRRYQGLFATLIIVTVIPAFALLRPVIAGEMTFQAWLAAFPNVPLPIVMVFPALFFIAAGVGYVIDSDLRAEHISTTIGEAELWTSGTIKRYFLRVDGVRFQITRDYWKTFTAGQTYRVYYIKNYPNIILSSERLQAA
jgi:hypothetical protein